MEGVGRKAAVAVASTGMLTAVGAAPALAASDLVDGAGLTSTQASSSAALSSAQASSVLGSSSLASVPADADWALEAPTVTVVDPPPPPPPPPPTRSNRSYSAPAATPVAVAPPASVAGNVILEIAFQYQGVPYVYGGNTPRGFDCSGFVQYVYGQAGISIPRTDSQIRAAGTVVSAADARPGDVIWKPGHVAIFVGDGMQIDAPHTGTVVQVRAITFSNPVFLRF